ncbi:MAG: hypothetical protein RR998_00500 [Oscillospiraceae bacterium]
MSAKLTAAVIICGLLCATAGCAVQSPPASLASVLEKPFKLTAEYTSDMGEGAFFFEQRAPESCSIEFIEPTNICGMKLTREGDSVTSEYSGITSECEFADLRRSNPLVALSRLASAACVSEIDGDRKRDGVHYFLADGSELVALSEIPRSIMFPYCNLTLKVTSFEYI